MLMVAINPLPSPSTEHQVEKLVGVQPRSDYRARRATCSGGAAPRRHSRAGLSADRSPPMETQALSLSPSEKLTLKHLSEGELHTEHLDWVALQRLKRLGLVEDRNSGPALTQEGRRTLQRLLAGA